MDIPQSGFRHLAKQPYGSILAGYDTAVRHLDVDRGFLLWRIFVWIMDVSVLSKRFYDRS